MQSYEIPLYKLLNRYTRGPTRSGDSHLQEASSLSVYVMTTTVCMCSSLAQINLFTYLLAIPCSIPEAYLSHQSQMKSIIVCLCVSLFWSLAPLPAHYPHQKHGMGLGFPPSSNSPLVSFRNLSILSSPCFLILVLSLPSLLLP